MMYRAAETLFWIGRYMERAENNARRINVHYLMRQVLSEFENEQRWEKLISSLGDIYTFKQRYEQANEKTALQFLILDQSNSNSLYSSILYTRNNIRSLRQLLPSELWDSINEFYMWFNKQNMDMLTEPSPYLFYQHYQDLISRFNGTAYSSMLRDNVWNFIQAGKSFERAENTLRLLHSFYLNYLDQLDVSNSDNYNRYILLLKSAGGYEAFRKLQADDFNLSNVSEFLILYDHFPRSVQYAISKLENRLYEIQKQDSQFEPLVEASKDFVVTMKENIKMLQNNEYEAGLQYIEAMFQSMNALGQEISNTFFQEGKYYGKIENLTHHPIQIRELGYRQCQ